MTTKSNISVLPIESYMKYYVEEEDGRIENYLKPIKPILNRDGYFYDRTTKKCWYEYKGYAFEIKASQFIYCMELNNTKRLTQTERKAYHQLLSYGVSAATRKEFKHTLYMNERLDELRNIYLDGYRCRRYT